MAKLDIVEFVKESGEIAKKQGFWDREIPIPESCALIHSEVSEILEEARKGKGVNETYYREDGKIEGIPSELADVIIRCFEFAAYHNIDLETIMKEKQAYNSKREHMHGKLF